jgi:type IV pilus assembly protein PilA
MLARIHKAMEERDEGFTLIELLVVIIIIGILAAIAIPVFLNQRKKGWDSQAKSDLRNAATAEETYLTDNDFYTTANASLISAGYKPTTGVTLTVSKLYDANGTTTGTLSGAYCMYALSKSGNYFEYISTAGGLQSTVTTTAPTCPASVTVN